ncbi:Globin-like protein 6 [Trichinella murrelli]|uniref:Globin-like protein 6 n=1 Tax=Trichinella murrelli TaxID=144512 RepID=A0A0V0TRZ2_9BILA|nr:Globin-like protein 6 [Trichinella murrelli]
MTIKSNQPKKERNCLALSFQSASSLDVRTSHFFFLRNLSAYFHSYVFHFDSSLLFSREQQNYFLYLLREAVVLEAAAQCSIDSCQRHFLGSCSLNVILIKPDANAALDIHLEFSFSCSMQYYLYNHAFEVQFNFQSTHPASAVAQSNSGQSMLDIPCTVVFFGGGENAQTTDTKNCCPMGGQLSFLPSKSATRASESQQLGSSCTTLTESKEPTTTVERNVPMTMSCIFADEVGRTERRGRHVGARLVRRLFKSGKLLRRCLPSKQVEGGGLGFSTVPSERASVPAKPSSSVSVPDFDAIFEDAALRQHGTLTTTGLSDGRGPACTTGGGGGDSSSSPTTNQVVATLNSDSNGGCSLSSDEDNFSSCSSSKVANNSSANWRRTMSLKVTFDECKSTSTSDSDNSRKPSNASTNSSRKERLCRATSTCTVRCPTLATPVRRWLSTADMVCDQEFLDLINGILPLENDHTSKVGAAAATTTTPTTAAALSVQRSSIKRSSRRLELQPLLNAAQIKLIRNHWKGMYVTIGPTAIGNHLFNRIVFKNPHWRKLFMSILIDHRTPGYFSKRHARAIGVVLNFVIKNLELPETVGIMLNMIGHCHATLVGLGVDVDLWDVFAEALLECSLEWGEKNRRVDEVRKAWAIIIAFITEKIKAGYNEARKGIIYQQITFQRII